MHDVVFGSWGDAEKFWELLLWGIIAALTKTTGILSHPINYLSIYLNTMRDFSTRQGQDFFSQHQNTEWRSL